METGALQQAIDMIKAGEKNKARLLLWDLISAEPENEAAWLWFAACVHTDAQRKYCLEKALTINPENERARQALQKMAATELPDVDLLTGSPQPAEKRDSEATQTIGAAPERKEVPPVSRTEPDGLTAARCLSCGGSLEIPPLAETAKCPYCGTDHMIHRRGSQISLEAFARCPVCNRNDKTQKVSSIVISQTHLTSTRQQQVRMGAHGRKYAEYVDGPAVSTQVSILAQRLTLPPPPVKQELHYRFYLIVMALILAAAGMIAYSNLSREEEIYTALFIGAAFFLFIEVLYTIGFFIRKKDAEEEFEHNTRWWEYAKRRWEKLYYCSRDDLVFVPDEGSWASSIKAREYLYEVPGRTETGK